MKVLVVHPDLRKLGGVENYYTILKTKWNMPIEHHEVGRRIEEKPGKLTVLFRLIRDYIKFVRIMATSKHEVIHVNTGLEYEQFLREGVFTFIAWLFGKKTIVHWRSWYKTFESDVIRRWMWFFKFFYNRASVFIVLTGESQRMLESWGCTQPIYREVTVIDDILLNNFNMTTALAARENSEKFRLLLIARISRLKGIFEAVDAFELLQETYDNLEFVIAGSGNDLDELTEYIGKKGIKNIVLPGFVSGEDKLQLYKSSHVLFFPSHSEAFPNAVVESMGFGLPVVARNVGSLVDFFENGTHGYTTDSYDPVDFAGLLTKLIDDPELYRKMSQTNYDYAQKNFLASGAVSRLETIYKTVMGEKK